MAFLWLINGVPNHLLTGMILQVLAVGGFSLAGERNLLTLICRRCMYLDISYSSNTDNQPKILGLWKCKIPQRNMVHSRMAVDL